jgi:hypothetical protein
VYISDVASDDAEEMEKRDVGLASTKYEDNEQ